MVLSKQLQQRDLCVVRAEFLQGQAVMLCLLSSAGISKTVSCYSLVPSYFRKQDSPFMELFFMGVEVASSFALLFFCFGLFYLLLSGRVCKYREQQLLNL